MINVKELYKSFEKKDVLKGISFKINHGESVAIIGKSGIGKSVLLKHLIGLIQPDSGEVWVEEKLVNTLSFTQLQSVRAQCGMVFQFGALFDSMSVEENIGLALSKLSEMNKEEVTQQISKSLAEVGMENSEKLMPSSLSGGMKKRVGIARAIAIKPKYLLYDEPTTGLDPVMTDSINRLISKIHKQEDVTSIMVTHELRTVFEVAERVIMIHDGKIKFDGTPEQIKLSNDIVVQQFISGNSTLLETEA
ncbi:MAG: ATP-binding cassette domain-containing protein [Candidatus Marinimicrobia bacterium]|nr:ATP-binding cassette domain-containing protein [Candidatus Neomarinimicrobiota bacterium]MBT7377463.1 ATP-binding cassette domain-containing protein [Candidatus Neomarinimicrobiota bacterium]